MCTLHMYADTFSKALCTFQATFGYTVRDSVAYMIEVWIVSPSEH